MKLYDLENTVKISSRRYMSKNNYPIEWSSYDECWYIGYNYDRPMSDEQIMGLEVLAIEPHTTYDLDIILDIQ